MTPGIYRDVPMATYRGWPGFGSTDLRRMRIGPPAMVPWGRANPERETDATKLGTAAHCAILEPGAFAARFAHKPDGLSFSTKEGKEWKAAVPDGVSILTHAEWQKVDAIVNAFHSKDIAHEAYEAAAVNREVSVAWNDPDTALPLKARPDFYIEGGHVYELKVTRHASAQSIAFRAYAEGWMHQLAHNIAGLVENGVKVDGGRIIAINPEPPQRFRVYCVEVKRDALSLMHLENERTYKALAECVEFDEWPGSWDVWEKIEAPAIALQEAAAVVWGEEQEEVRHG